MEWLLLLQIKCGHNVIDPKATKNRKNLKEIMIREKDNLGVIFSRSYYFTARCIEENTFIQLSETGDKKDHTS